MQLRRELVSTFGFVAVAAAQVYQGFNYDAVNNDGSCRGYPDFYGFFERAKNLAGTEGHFAAARLYTSIECGTTADPISAFQAAIDTNTDILVGLWASAGRDVFGKELTALLAATKQLGAAFTDHVIGISVGSEDLFRSSVQGQVNDAGAGATSAEIEGYIGWARDWIRGTALDGKPIGHVDTWTSWIAPENAGVVSSVDFLGHNAFPYFETTRINAIDQATDNFWSGLKQTESVAGGKPVFITETGWPSMGPQQRDAVASLDNAKGYYSQIGCALFGQRTTFWYTLVDSNMTQADISFALTPIDSATPRFDLTC
ncbi:glycoside hydrolase family 17 protein [Annulohypoxylon maeteangense]|uniref:glycoside hydrolase family 17 protein n=1 Tax=Annulohypoxylon maeteangense TaxID=1927788 RepID=UPI0020087C86|nr:glycoside hydrolase family 17 protein [Annulohypoxylon maeteangense]KAI0889809.1 glycoside hydrolase family 17 protein [Annulohypoxylon maeteangense]